MAKTGRKTAAERAISPEIDARKTRLRAPAELSAEERAVYSRIVGSADPQAFVESDLPLLVAYCQAVAQNQRAARGLNEGGDVVDGKPSPWLIVQREARHSMATLSLRLRISPQARRERALKT